MSHWGKTEAAAMSQNHRLVKVGKELLKLNPTISKYILVNSMSFSKYIFTASTV